MNIIIYRVDGHSLCVVFLQVGQVLDISLVLLLLLLQLGLNVRL